MKKLVAALAVLFWMGVWAQESVKGFRKGFGCIPRVAETPCSEQLRLIFPEGVSARLR